MIAEPATSVRPRRIIVALAVLIVLATACGTSTAVPPTTASPGSGATSTSGGGGTTASTRPSGGSTTSTVTAVGCSLTEIFSIINESSTSDQERAASWVRLQANDWTVFAPDGSWHLSASTAGGADVVSPDGLSDSSLGSDTAQTAWTYQTLAEATLPRFSNVKDICNSGNEKAASGESEATEFTGVNNGLPVHGIYVLTLLNPTASGAFSGEVRYIYAPASQWSTSTEQTLWLIIKLAVFAPQAP